MVITRKSEGHVMVVTKARYGKSLGKYSTPVSRVCCPFHEISKTHIGSKISYIYHTL